MSIIVDNLREFALCILTSSGKHARLVWFGRGFVSPVPVHPVVWFFLAASEVGKSDFNLPKNRQNRAKLLLFTILCEKTSADTLTF